MGGLFEAARLHSGPGIGARVASPRSPILRSSAFSLRQTFWRESVKSQGFGDRVPDSENASFRFACPCMVVFFSTGQAAAASAFRRRSPQRISNWFSASRQPCTVSHFAEALRSARYSSLSALSSFGNEPRFLITLRRLMCSDSTALVV